MSLSIYNKLLELGAVVVEEPRIRADRQKFFGRMWGGRASLELNGEQFNFELWHNGGDTETVESLLPHFSLKGISNSDRIGYDCHWHTVITPWGILYKDKEGWFRNRELDKLVGSHNNNFPERVTEAEVERLLSIGLQWLIKW